MQSKMHRRQKHESGFKTMIAYYFFKVKQYKCQESLETLKKVLIKNFLFDSKIKQHIDKYNYLLSFY